VARRLTPEGAGNVVLEKMRDVGLDGPPRIIEEISAGRTQREDVHRQHRDGEIGDPRMAPRCHAQTSGSRGTARQGGICKRARLGLVLKWPGKTDKVPVARCCGAVIVRRLNRLTWLFN
jgi:hypothetical protein